MKLKLLVLSFWTPPAVRPRAIAAGKIIPELVRQGVSPVIMTYQTCGEWEIDLPTYKIEEPKRSSGKILGLLSEIKYYFYLFNLTKKIIKKHGINIVFSFSNPQESNILGALIKKRLGIPFASHFSDPWTDNPYKTFSGLSSIKARFLERFVIKNSDRVVFTNQVALDLVMKKYSNSWRAKVVVISHAFDSRQYPLSPAIGGTKWKDTFVISHIGSFNKKRTPEALILALERLAPEVRARIEIRFIGAQNEYVEYHDERFKKWILPVVSYKESLSAMKDSNLLVIIDAPLVNSPFLPSKVVDYAGSGTAIIAITPTGSPTFEFVKRLGYWAFDNSDVAGIAECIDGVVRGTLHPEVDSAFLKQFEVGFVAARFIALFQEIVWEKK